MSQYLFILSPPFSGSTLLWKLLATSESVSSLPTEGQHLSEIKKIMRQDPWNPKVTLPWHIIKKTWHKYWDREKSILMEKSPPNLFRTQSLLEHFTPLNFLILVRDPYANCEGVMRRRNWGATRAALFIMNCLKQQTENANTLSNAYVIKYEHLVNNPIEICQKIASFLPALGSLDPTRNFKVQSMDGLQDRKIVYDLNQRKIANLSPLQLYCINKIFKKHPDIMQYWGYEYYTLSKQHCILFIKTKLRLIYNSIFSLLRVLHNHIKDLRPFH